MEHISRQIPPKAHTAMYNWHKFWGRKTWNVVAEFVDTYCPKDGIVMDPFSGSGVTALEALNLNTFLKDTSDICIITGSCIDVLDKMPARSVDYIFTDPPYDASIQYGELSYMWAAWLKKDEG